MAQQRISEGKELRFHLEQTTKYRKNLFYELGFCGAWNLCENVFEGTRKELEKESLTLPLGIFFSCSFKFLSKIISFQCPSQSSFHPSSFSLTRIPSLVPAFYRFPNFIQDFSRCSWNLALKVIDLGPLFRGTVNTNR